MQALLKATQELALQKEQAEGDHDIIDTSSISASQEQSLLNYIQHLETQITEEKDGDLRVLLEDSTAKEAHILIEKIINYNNQFLGNMKAYIEGAETAANIVLFKAVTEYLSQLPMVLKGQDQEIKKKMLEEKPKINEFQRIQKCLNIMQGRLIKIASLDKQSKPLEWIYQYFPILQQYVLEIQSFIVSKSIISFKIKQSDEQNDTTKSKGKTKRKQKKKKIEDDDDDDEQSQKTVKGYSLAKQGTIAEAGGLSLTQRKKLDQMKQGSSIDTLIEYYQEKRIICNSIFDEWKHHFEGQQRGYYIAKLTKNQVVKRTERDSFLDLVNIDEVKKYIENNSHNYNVIEQIKPLAKGGEAQILRLKVIQPIETVVKIPLPQENDYLNAQALNLILMESHLLKLIAHKEYIAEIMEEIIEYNAATKKIQSYVCIVEQASNDLSKILAIWEKKALSQEKQEFFSQEKLAYFCLKAMEAMEYVHSKRIYFGDMKPQNLLVFRDFSVKLGDFGVSVKFPDEVQDLSNFECELKGLTTDYSLKNVIEKYEVGEKITYKEMIQNDYYSLYKTFEQIFEKFQQKIETNSFFYWMLYDLKELNVDSKELKTILFKWRAILANDSDFILNLCDTIIREEKIFAIPNILKLSKYKNIFSEIQSKFAKQEQQELQYVNEKQYQPLEEDDLLLDSQFERTQDIYANIYIQLSLSSQLDKAFISNVIKDIDPYFQKLFQFRGALPVNDYKLYYQKEFECFYNNASIEHDITWDNFLNKPYEQLLNFFKENVEIFNRFAKFFSVNCFDENLEGAKKIKILIKLAVDLKLYNLELDLIQSQLNILTNIYDENISKDLEQNLQRVQQISQQYLHDDLSNEKIIACHILFANSLFVNKKITKTTEIKEVMKEVKDFENYQSCKAKSFYSNFYLLKAKITVATASDQEQANQDRFIDQEYYLKRERKAYSKIFGEQGDQMNRNASDLYQLYKETDNQEKKFYYLKKIANYSFKNQKIKFMTTLAQEYSLKDKQEEFKQTLQSFRKINPAFEYLLVEAFDRPYDIGEDGKKQCLDLIRSYKFIEDFISNQLDQLEIYKKGLLLVIGIQYQEDADIFNLYNEWVNSKDQENFAAFDMKAYLLQSQQIDENYDPIEIKQVTITFPNGTKFDGQIQNFKFQGQGVIDFYDGMKFEGDFFENKKQGKGRYSYPDGSYYDGQWFNDKKNGFGQYKQANGYCYEGNWLNDKRNGSGKLFFENEEVYDGKWKLNQKNGYGKQTFPDKSVYKGKFKNNKKEGLGTMLYYNGDIYHGMWKDNQRNGSGVMMESSGSIYEGNFENDKKNGRGKMTYATDEKIQYYDGEWLNDQKHGNGKLRFINGDEYEGQYQFDKRQGKGKFVYSNEDIFEGEWKDDKKNGSGKLIIKNGETYEGQFFNDYKQGVGIITNKLQEKQTFNFYCNERIEQIDTFYPDGSHYIGSVILNSELKQGEGKLIFPNGDKYQGFFINDLMHGDGIYEYSNLETYDGQFEYGKRHGRATVKSKNGGERFEGFYFDDMKQGKATIFNEQTGKKFKVEFFKNNPLEYKEAKYPNGDSYEGWFCHGKKQGQGQMMYANGDKYIGEFSDDKKTGKGTFINAKFEKYEGMFCDDERHGYGVITQKNGQKIYEGEFFKNKWQGRGVLYLSNGNKYDGNFENGIRKGKGVMNYANGDRYDGEFENDVRHGQGVMTYNVGGNYTGQFVNDKRHGHGVWTYQNGDVYDGMFENDVKQGKGSYKYSNGSKYDGYFENDEKQGNGSYVSNNSEKFDGFFDHKTLKGKGVLLNRYSDRYEGEVNNLFERHGYGVFKDTDGWKYEGQYFKGKRQGKGIYYYKDGDIFEGWFDNDYRIRGILKMFSGDVFIGGFESGNISNGEYKYKTGDIYTGQFNSSKERHGQGVFIRNNGDRYKGEFKSDNYDGKGKVKFANGDTFKGVFTSGQCKQGLMLKPDGIQFNCEFKNGEMLQKTEFTNDKGDKYNGQVDGNESKIKQGYGILEYANGNKYTGWFNCDKREGQGKLEFANGILYVGEFVNDIIQGQGFMIYIDGEKTTGTFSTTASEGIQLYDNGDLYSGQFSASQKSGKGKLKTQQGDVYEGYFQDDKKHGEGVFNYFNGDKYQGLYKADLKYKGILTLANGDVFDGEFNNDVFIEIKTDHVFENGDTYTGQLLDNKKQGKGSIKLSNGDSYIGWFNDDLIEGKGIYTYSNGEVFEGEFLKSIRQKGKLTKPNGDVFEGDFKDSNLYKGTYTKSDGTVQFGEFDSDSQFLPIKELIKENNAKYKGQVLNDKMHGNGVLTFSNNIKFDGWFADDKIEGNGDFILLNGEKVHVGVIDASVNADNFKQYDNGDIYIGEMSGYLRHGKGVFIQTNGVTESGTFESDKLNFDGMRIFQNGDKYIGEFSSNEMCGRGYMVFANGEKDELCYYYENKKCEKKEKIESNGDKYVGQFKTDGKRNGRAILYYANGDIYDGWFDFDRMHTYGWKNKHEDVYGIMTYANGEKYKVWYYENDCRKKEKIE